MSDCKHNSRALSHRTGGRAVAREGAPTLPVGNSPGASASGALSAELILFLDEWVYPSDALRWDGQGECPF